MRLKVGIFFFFEKIRVLLKQGPPVLLISTLFRLAQIYVLHQRRNCVKNEWYLNFKFLTQQHWFFCSKYNRFFIFCCRLHSSFPPQTCTYSMKNARWLGIFALAFITTFNTKECCGQSESLLRVGKAINVFIRYGYLSISMKVISYNDTERWIFKEPTKNIFQVFNRFYRVHADIQKNLFAHLSRGYGDVCFLN